MHVYPRERKGKSSVVSKESKERINANSFGNGKSPPSSNIKQEDSQHSENGRTEHMGMSSEPALGSEKSLSPYPKARSSQAHSVDSVDSVACGHA